MDWLDFLIGLFYAFFILIAGYLYFNNKFKNEEKTRKAFIYGLFFKIVSSLLFGVVYKFYYGYGDSITYLIAGNEFLTYIVDHPSSFLDIMLLNNDTINSNFNDFLLTSNLVPDYFATSNLFVHKAVIILGFFCGYSYFALNVLFALLSFWGCSKIYLTFSKLYPEFHDYFKISFLYLPSVVFWTAGIGKDALSICFINLFAHACIQAFIFKKNYFFNLVLMILSVYITYKIKSYIVLSFVPLFLYFIITIKLKNIESGLNKILIKSSLFLFGGTLFITLFFYSSIINDLSNDIIEGAFKLTKGQINSSSENDSAYNLGITLDDLKSKNIAPYILPSINVALFRPFIWEINKPLMLISFFESFFFLLFTLFVLFKSKIVKCFKIIFSNELVFFCIFYTIIFSFFVGLVSANFGTLVRYKTPFISYFLIALFIIRYKLMNNDTNTSTTNEELKELS